jgi:hypothetical protein
MATSAAGYASNIRLPPYRHHDVALLFLGERVKAVVTPNVSMKSFHKGLVAAVLMALLS